MFVHRWYAVEGDPYYYADYTAAVVVGVLLLLVLAVSLRGYVRARRRGIVITFGASRLLTVCGVAGAAWLLCGGLLSFELPEIAAGAGVCAAVGALYGLVRAQTRHGNSGARVARAMCVWGMAIAAPAVLIAGPMVARGIVTGEGERATGLFMVLSCAQQNHYYAHGVYGPAETLYKAGDSFPRVPGHPEALHYKWDFTSIATRGGKLMDPKTECGLCATPKRYLGTAQYTLIMDQRGIPAPGAADCGYFYKDTRGVRIDDFPGDPEAQGWTAYRPWEQ